MRNLLTEVSRIKNMMGLNSNINEQTSTMDFYNKYFGSDDKKEEPNLMGKGSSMTPSSGGVIDAVKAGAKKIAKIAKEKSSNSNTVGVGTVSDKLVNFVANIEFFVKCVYDDAKGGKCLRKEPDCCLRGKSPTPGAKATIGYGTTYYPGGIPVKPNDPDITETRAKELMRNTLNKNAKKILNLYPNLNQQQLDAMASLCYQMGPDGCTTEAPNLSAALKSNPNNLQNVGQHFVDFPFKDRREKEWKIYSQGIYS